MNNLNDYIKKHRRELHKIPELSFQEFRTQEYLLNELKSLGLKTRTVKTGIIVDIKGEEKKKAFVALRADMDALPILEKNNVPYKSLNEGVMHACGHDGHMAMLLGVAKTLSEKAPKYNTRLIFQPGEEGDGGAESLIDAGVLKDVGEIYGLHLAPDIEKGVFASGSGAIFAGTVEFDVTFYGRAAHCAEEEKSDAMLASMRFYSSILERMAKYKNMLLHLGAANGGSARNIVADNVKQEWTMRFFSEFEKEEATLLIAHTLNEVDDLCKTEHRVVVNAVYPPLVNSSSCYTIASNANKIVQCSAKFTAEDFAFYCQKTNGCFTWLGTKEEKFSSPLHSSTFDFDDDVLEKGSKFFLNLIM